jgi:hypothetical protein
MRFRYLRDPLLVGCVIVYFVNRFLIKRLIVGGFFHEHLNDLICIPFWVPIMVFLLRRAGLRRDDDPPHADEILIPLVMWSVIFELYLPHVKYFERLAVSDYADIFYYALGALAASVFWQVWYESRRPAHPPRAARAPDRPLESPAPLAVETGKTTASLP